MLQCTENYKIRPEQDGSFIFDIRNRTTLVGNTTATQILTFLRDKHTAPEVIAHLEEIYSAEIIRQHTVAIIGFLQQALQKDFLVGDVESPRCS